MLRTLQIVYIIFATLLSTIVLFYYSKLLPEVISKDTLSLEVMMCSGQIIWQGIIVILFIKKKLLSYLYTMITVSLLGSLALIPFLIINQFIYLDILWKISYFFVIVILMIAEHTRRIKKLQLPSYLTLTWVIYRVFWLPILIL